MPFAAHEYWRAANPEPFQVLGVRLKPLSLQHCIDMQAFDVAFVSSGEAVATFEDLIFGVLICSRNWNPGEFHEYILSKKGEKDVAKWGRSAGLFNLKEKVVIFQKYIENGSAQPRFWDNPDCGGVSGAHWTQSVLLTLTGQLNYTRQDALHCPLTQALADYYKHAESNGVIKLWLPHENALYDQAKAQEVASGD